MTDISKKELKEVAKKIVLSQGNKYIKELLRKNGVKIGKNKSEFLENLISGIEEGQINQEKIDAWLEETEGWGNQHVYLFETPQVSHQEVRNTILESPHAPLLENPELYDFPEELSLRTVNVNDGSVLLGWRQGRDSWVRSKAKDYREEVDGDEYEFRAYREKSERKLVRFLWEFGKPYCAVYITQANEEGLHDKILSQVWVDINNAGLCDNPLPKISLTSAFTKLNNRPELKVNSVKLNVDGGHVNLVATVPKTGIHDIEAIRQAQKGIDAEQFSSSDGVFHFSAENLEGISRLVKVEGAGTESRIRIWAQCTRADVDLIVEEINTSR